MGEYRPKCRDYMESIQQGHLCERIDLFTAEGLWQRVSDIHSYGEQYVNKMAEGISRLQTLQLQRARQVADRIRAASMTTA